MDTQKLINKINVIFWNKEQNDDEVANEILDLLDENKEVVQFDSELRAAHKELNIWSRTERETGIYLDQIKDILNLEEIV